MYKLYLFIILIFSLTSNCKQENLTPIQYETYFIENNESVTFNKELPKYTFSAEYLPTEYLALKEFEDKDNIDKNTFESKLSEYSGMQYYTFKILLNKGQDIMYEGLADQSQYNDRVQYLSFNISEDFKLVQGKDTLSCLMNHFERNYGLAPYIKLSLAFEDNGFKDKRTLIYTDNVFNNGIVKIEIPQDEINKIPNIIF